jgi:hypothetical protein
MSAPVTMKSRQDSDLWMIYANKIRETYFPGAEIGAKNRIYIPPLNQQAIPAGARIDAAVTNYGISKVGDGLIEPDNPLMTFSGETYAQKCLRYLQNVQLVSGPPCSRTKCIQINRLDRVELAVLG